MAVLFVPEPGESVSIQQCNDGSVTVTLDGGRTYEFGRPRDAYSFLRELYPPRHRSARTPPITSDWRAALYRKPWHD